MGKVIPFKKANNGSLNDLLERAVILRKAVLNSDDGILVDVNAVEKIFEGKISEILINNRLISECFFLCGVYISGMLRDFIYSCPQSWQAIDYFEEAVKKDNPFYAKLGADVCFFLCSLFEDRTNHRRRVINKKTYIEIGGMLYYKFFSETDSDIGFLMSQNFETMAEVTNEAVAKMKGG